ncbi:unnamed protein product [Diatraea saccharalis]|uniref:EH domain-binding protein 1 n=1 Tax=Diatraea saccharalis TaxID=40085 RepID=A0A9N9WFP9_9NEOP|nr:unnamed protein product [Diatraea saccharalis]
MASVWKRLQRVNKRAAKFEYTASYHRIDLETTPKWKPNKLSVVWTRRSRRVLTEPKDWEPSLKDPLKGSVIFPVPENHTVAVTLFKDSRTNELEDKDWTFVLEDVSATGKRRRVASCNVNMRKYASLEPAQRPLRLKLDPCTAKVAAASLHLTLHSVLLREGPATDEDMQSVASLLSVNNNSDIAVLEDLEEDDITLSDHSTKQMLDLRQQMEEMTQSLTSSDMACTPNSVQSLKFDPRTPTDPLTPTPTQPAPMSTLPASTNSALTSTPVPGEELPPRSELTAQLHFDDTLKGAIFKPRTVAKRNLKPLELKTNLNNIGLDSNYNESDADKTPTPGDRALNLFTAEKDNTPVGELVRWCSVVTREYGARCACDQGLRSGLAFCAIIHRFRPDLIDFSGLQPEDAETNLKVALEASAALGLPRVLCPADVLRPVPDKLAIMTYLFQLRAYFTDNELQVEQLGNDETESSYLVGRHDTDGALSRDLFSREVSARRSRTLIRPANIKTREPVTPPSEVSPRHKPTAHWYAPLTPTQVAARPERLMTRKELTDPFGSDEEDESPQHTVKNDQKPSIEPATTDPLNCLQTNSDSDNKQNDNRTVPEDNRTLPDESRTPPDTNQQENKQQKATTPDLPKPTPQLLSRHDELKERARQLLEATKREAREKDRLKRQSSKEKEQNEVVKENGLRNGDTSPKKPMTEEERQAMLRERARKLIADARAGILSPTSPLSPSRTRPTLEIISKQSLMDEIAAAGGVESPMSPASPTRRSPVSPDASEELSESSGRDGRGSTGGSPLRSFSALVDRLTPDKDNLDESRETGSYIQSELEALEREQKSIDERAAALEKQLRRVMEAAGNTEEEDRLMSQWFNLVNKKNALLRRQMQLNILEQEEDLSRRCELLARELRLSLGVDEWRKTPGQKRRERLLLQELLSAVNERDRLVQEMDEQEKAIADDDAIERNLSQVEIQRKNNCILQ